MCILHGLMCIGRIVANQVHALCVRQDPAVVVEVGRISREYKTGFTPKGKAEPDGEESWRLLVAWNKLSGVLFIDNAIDGAVRGMARALTALYQTWHDPQALKISQAARALGNALRPDSKSPYLVFLYTTASLSLRISNHTVSVCSRATSWSLQMLLSKICTITTAIELVAEVQKLT